MINGNTQNERSMVFNRKDNMYLARAILILQPPENSFVFYNVNNLIIIKQKLISQNELGEQNDSEKIGNLFLHYWSKL